MNTTMHMMTMTMNMKMGMKLNACEHVLMDMNWMRRDRSGCLVGMTGQSCIMPTHSTLEDSGDACILYSMGDALRNVFCWCCVLGHEAQQKRKVWTNTKI